MKLAIPRLVLFLCFVICFSPPHASAQNGREKDSLRRVIARTEGAEQAEAYDRLTRLYLVEARKEGVLDTLMALYDDVEALARKAGDLPREGITQANRLKAYYNRGDFDQVIERAPKVLEFLARNELWKDYYQTYTLLPEAYRVKGEYEKALDAANEVYLDAKGRNDRAGMGLAQLAVCKICFSQRRFAEAEKSARESIDLLQDETSYLNFLVTAYNRLACSQIGQEHYDDAIRTARASEAVNRRYEAASHSPQPSAWYNLWLTCTDIYRQNGDFDKAQVYVDKIDSITNGSVRMYKERGHILYGKGRYREALVMLDSAILASPKSLENQALKLMTLTQMREPEKAVELFTKVIGELESRHNESFNARLDAIRTQYEVDKYVAEKERNRNYFLFALGGCALLAVLLGLAFYYNRLITRKNIGLYNRLREQDRLEEELARMRTQAAQADAEACDAAAELPGDRQQRELVDRLREYLLRERNLVHADNSRDELVAALGTNKNTLTEAVKAVTGKTPMEYIRAMQLEQARHLLDKHPELTVESVAFDCGFNAPNTFYRLFRKHYGISPAEYRKIAGSVGQ